MADTNPSPLTVEMGPAVARLSIRATGDAVRMVSNALSLSLPVAACRSMTHGQRSVLWLGPDEWLLIEPDADVPALVAWIAEGLGETPASLVDVSDRNVAIAVSGPKAAEALNAFNPLDLSLAAFPVGMCTRTIFGKAEIVLWRTGAEVFHIEVWRSFAPYVLGSLEEAGREYAT